MLEDEPIKVTDIYEDSQKYRINDNNYCIRYFKPIPLTEEILEINGFAIGNEDPILKGWSDNKLKDQDFYCNTRGDLGFSLATAMVEGADGSMYPCEFADVKYVHELQHALKLCGLSELADSFKV